MRDITEFVNRALSLPERGCLSKARFDSQREARNLVRHGRHSDGSVEPYHCRICDYWHLGHRRQTNRHRHGYAIAA
jgi:hypothetical protein